MTKVDDLEAASFPSGDGARGGSGVTGSAALDFFAFAGDFFAADAWTSGRLDVSGLSPASRAGRGVPCGPRTAHDAVCFEAPTEDPEDHLDPLDLLAQVAREVPGHARAYCQQI